MIPAPDFRDRLIGPVMTDGIIKGLLEVARFRRIQDQVASIAHLFKGEGGQEKLWNYVREHIKYVTDPIGKQFLQHPKLLWFRKLGDCKSMTLFVSAVLQALNIPHLIRFTKYSTKSVGFTHVYCVVDGVPIDTVWHTYGTEKRYLAKKDYHIMTELHEVSGVAEHMDIDAYISGLEDDFAVSGLDYETDRYHLNTDHLEAIVRIPQEIAGIDGFGQTALNLGKKAMNYAGPAAKKILNSGAGKAIKGAVQKVIKKLAGPLLDKLMAGLVNQFGEYFLFLFIRQEWQIGAVKTRIEGQRKLLTWFGKVTGKKQDELMPMIKKGIEKKFGMTLQELFKKELGVRLAGRNVPGIGYVVVVTTMMKYLPTIVDQVGKFIGESAPVKNLQQNASNMDVLAQELEKKFPKQKQDPKPNPPHGGGKGQPVGGDKISLPPDQRGGKGTNNGGGGGKNNGGGGGTNNGGNGGGGTGGNNRNNGDQTPIDDNNGNNSDNNGNNGSNTNGNNGNTSSGGISTGMMVAGGVGLGLLALAMNSGSKKSKKRK